LARLFSLRSKREGPSPRHTQRRRLPLWYGDENWNPFQGYYLPRDHSPLPGQWPSWASWWPTGIPHGS